MPCPAPTCSMCAQGSELRACTLHHSMGAASQWPAQLVKLSVWLCVLCWCGCFELACLTLLSPASVSQLCLEERGRQEQALPYVIKQPSSHVSAFEPSTYSERVLLEGAAPCLQNPRNQHSTNQHTRHATWTPPTPVALEAPPGRLARETAHVRASAGPDWLHFCLLLSGKWPVLCCAVPKVS